MNVTNISPMGAKLLWHLVFFINREGHLWLADLAMELTSFDCDTN